MTNRKITRVDEFKAFLTAPVVDASKFENALQWWKSHESEYPNVARMA
ncbi:unnamed protein product, partial [Allacma fusca]